MTRIPTLKSEPLKQVGRRVQGGAEAGIIDAAASFGPLSAVELAFFELIHLNSHHWLLECERFIFGVL